MSALNTHSSNVQLTPNDNRRLALLCGQFDEHLRQMERHLNVEINNRGNLFHIIGAEHSVNTAGKILINLYKETENINILTPAMVHLFIHESNDEDTIDKFPEYINSIKTKYATARARSHNQRLYLQKIRDHDINFAIGPAGTGKTFLAVASAVAALEQDEVQRIILIRPAVEAGERLGFLPGDLAQKVDPYLRPLYDALNYMLGYETVVKLVERNIIEIAPLAYMRGRTLNDSFIILDESQNATIQQMKMFLTRIGFGSTAVITGDVTQIDLPSGQRSGLHHAREILTDVKGISFSYFDHHDVIRHPLVKDIIQAYEKHEKKRDEH